MKFSIITINRNNAEGLRKTIESVISQTFTNFEYIIIDGASTDGSVDLIKEYADKITYWVSEPDKGIYNAMNKGILQATGEYCLFLNSGDWLYNNTLLKNVFSLDKKEDIIYGNAIGKMGIKEIFPNNLTAFFFYSSAICHQAIFHKKELFSSKQYNENYQFVSDWEFLLKSIIFENKSYSKIDLIIIGQQPDSCYSSILANKERKAVLSNLFPPLICNDFNTLEKIYQNPFFPYMQILDDNPKLRRLIKRLIKLFLTIKGQEGTISN